MDTGEPEGALENPKGRPGRQTDMGKETLCSQDHSQVGPQDEKLCHFCHLTWRSQWAPRALVNTGQMPRPITEVAGGHVTLLPLGSALFSASVTFCPDSKQKGTYHTLTRLLKRLTCWGILPKWGGGGLASKAEQTKDGKCFLQVIVILFSNV